MIRLCRHNVVMLKLVVVQTQCVDVATHKTVCKVRVARFVARFELNDTGDDISTGR